MMQQTGNEDSQQNEPRGNASVFKRIVMLWRWIGTPDCWFLLMISFCVWTWTLSPSGPITGIVSTFIILALVMIWQLSRIANALDKKGEDK